MRSLVWTLCACVVLVLVSSAPVAAETGPTGWARPRADTLSLAEAIQTALSRNPAIEAGRADVSAEGAARWADWGALLPDVSGTADFARVEGTRFTFQGEEGVSRRSREPIDFVRKGVQQLLEVDWHVLDGGRRWFDLKEGAASRRAASFRLDARQREAVARVKRAYFEALKEQRLADAAERQLEARREEAEFTRHRREVGTATRADLLGARVEVGQAEVRHIDAERRSARDRRALREAMGVRAAEAPAVDRVASVDVPDAYGLDAKELVERAVSGDPRARALAAEAEAASAASGAAWTRYVPDVWLNYTKWRSEIRGPGADFFNFDPSDDFGQVTFSVTWDLFEGFGRREATARARAEARRARAKRTERLLELEAEVANRVDEIRARKKRLDVLERNRRLTRERLELARMRYREGQMDFEALQTLIDDVIAAEEAVYTERSEYLKAWSDLEQMVGDLASGPGWAGR